MNAVAKKYVQKITQREFIRLRNQDEKISKEQPDPTPVHIPGLTDQAKPLSLKEEMQRYVREQISRAAVDLGEESFEEANDFEVDDDDEGDILTNHSLVIQMAREAIDQPDPDTDQPNPVETDSEAPEGASPNPAPSPESDPPKPVTT